MNGRQLCRNYLMKSKSIKYFIARLWTGKDMEDGSDDMIFEKILRDLTRTKADFIGSLFAGSSSEKGISSIGFML
jgi:hypothetical protein